MDLIREVVSTPYVFPAGIVVLVISFAVLVFVFGFKTAQEPPFDQLSFTNDDRKPGGKKRKLKDKKSQSNGHAASVKEKSTKAKADSGKAVKQSPKQASKEAQKEQAKKKEAAPQLKEKLSTSKKSAAATKKSAKEQQEVEVLVKDETFDDDGGWEQVGKRNRKSSPPVSQDEKEKSNAASPVKEKKAKKTAEAVKAVAESTGEPSKIKVENEVAEESPKATAEKNEKEASTKAPKEKDVKEVSTKPTKEKDVKEAFPKVPKEKVSSAAGDQPLSFNETKESPKKTAPAKDISEGPEKKSVVMKTVEPEQQPEFKEEEKSEKKKRTVESAAFIENEMAAMKEEGKGDISTESKVDGAVFDELGDVWTEKVPKKSKKKVRKE